MQHTRKQIFNFQERLYSDRFMPKLTNSSIRVELLASIRDAYENRVRLKFTQQKYAELHQISLATLKRIENGECYDLILINKYCN